ncbi:MAG: ABC transporter permease [Chloroflexi bacterium]|nr:MAG: ABC transporter permease [Chloroflexota bacterium]
MSVQDMSMNQKNNQTDTIAMLDRMDAMVDEKPLTWWTIALIRLRKDKLTIAAFVVLLLITILCVGAGLISEYILHVGPDDTDILATFATPSPEHWLGTDSVGRDQLSRLLYGGRVSLAIGTVGSIFTLVLGISIGMSAAYFGKRVDDVIMWFINTLSSIPSLFLLLILGALFNVTPTVLTLLFGFLGWPFISRLVRSSVYSLKEREFIIASQALGASDITIMFRHILPNVLPVVIIATARRIGTLILSESALSFLGFGVQPPTATWGSMLTKAQQFILIPHARHLVVAPGVMIATTVLCLYIIGDGLRDALDPRLK